MELDGLTLFAVRLHFEYDRENYSNTEAVFTDRTRAIRYTVIRIANQSVDNDCFSLHSETLAAKLNLPEDTDLTEVETSELRDCLKDITSCKELEEILEDAFNSQDESTNLEKFFIDEVRLNDK